MSTLRTWQLIMLAAFTAVICIAVVQAVKYQSFMGMTAALGSIAALLICVNIMIKMNRLQEEEEF